MRELEWEDQEGRRRGYVGGKNGVCGKKTEKESATVKGYLRGSMET